MLAIIGGVGFVPIGLVTIIGAGQAKKAGHATATAGAGRTTASRPVAGWYIRQGDDVQGPFPWERLQQFGERGRLPATVSVSQDRTRWRSASEVRGLIDA